VFLPEDDGRPPKHVGMNIVYLLHSIYPLDRIVWADCWFSVISTLHGIEQYKTTELLKKKVVASLLLKDVEPPVLPWLRG
jgi:hypothetical protein